LAPFLHCLSTSLDRRKTMQSQKPTPARIPENTVRRDESADENLGGMNSDDSSATRDDSSSANDPSDTAF